MEYLFRCKLCEKEFSIFARIGTVDIREVKCPDCKSSVMRIWTPVHSHFHGKDFTKTVDKE